MAQGCTTWVRISPPLRLPVNLIALTPENGTKDAQLGFVFLLLCVFLRVSASPRESDRPHTRKCHKGCTTWVRISPPLRLPRRLRVNLTALTPENAQDAHLGSPRR